MYPEPVVQCNFLFVLNVLFPDIQVRTMFGDSHQLYAVVLICVNPLEFYSSSLDAG